MVILQGDLYWASLRSPEGSEAGFTRPVLVVQGDSLNQSRLRTVVCVPLTTSTRWLGVQGSVRLEAAETGLPHDSVARTDQILAVNKAALGNRVGRVSSETLDQVFDGLDIVLGRG